MTQPLLRPGMRATRFRPAPPVVVPAGEMPLLDRHAPAHKQVQEVWTARARVFDLSDPEQLQEYEKVWQGVCNSTTRVSENRIEWSPAKDNFKAYLRWADITYHAPT